MENNYTQVCQIDHYFQFPLSHLNQIEGIFLDHLIIEHNYLKVCKRTSCITYEETVNFLNKFLNLKKINLSKKH